MRVIAGSAGSRRLVFPKGAEVRPTSDMVREALFASLGERTIDAHFADLYAGSGSVGIEALSRGAQACVFIERDRRCLQALRANLESTGLGDRARVIVADCRRVAGRLWAGEPPDIVFLDPPYREDATALVQELLDLATASGRSSLVVLQCERGREPALPATREKRYGRTVLLFYECHPDTPTSDP